MVDLSAAVAAKEALERGEEPTKGWTRKYINGEISYPPKEPK